MKTVTLSISHQLHPRDPGWIVVPKEHMFQSVMPTAIARVWADPPQADIGHGTMVELCNGVVMRVMGLKATVIESIHEALAS